MASFPELTNRFYNADSLFFPIIYQELFLRPGANFLNGWKDLAWTPAFYFFPDLVQYFSLRTIFLALDSGAWESTHLVYAFLQWTLLILGIARLVRPDFKEVLSGREAFLALAFGYFFGAALLFFGKTVFVFLPGFHGGILVGLVWTWLFYLEWLRKRGRVRFLLLFLAVFLFSLSDLLFLPYFLLPILVSDLSRFRKFGKEGYSTRIFLRYVPVLSGLFLSYIVSIIFFRNPLVFFPGNALPLKVEWKRIGSNWNISEFADSFAFLVGENSIYLFIIFLAYLFLRFQRERISDSEGNRLRFFFLVLGTLVPLAFLIYGILFGLLGKGGFQTIDRYFGCILLSSLGLSFLSIYSLKNENLASWLSGILIFGNLFLILHTRDRDLRLIHTPNRQACLEKLAETHSLRRGLASFWYVRPMRIFSKSKWEPEDYLYDLTLFYWQNRLEWFEKEAPYSFAILDGLDEKIVREKFGEPKSVLDCEGAPVFLIEDPKGEKSKRFTEENRTKIRLWRKSVGRD